MVSFFLCFSYLLNDRIFLYYAWIIANSLVPGQELVPAFLEISYSIQVPFPPFQHQRLILHPEPRRQAPPVPPGPPGFKRHVWEPFGEPPEAAAQQAAPQEDAPQEDAPQEDAAQEDAPEEQSCCSSFLDLLSSFF